MNKIVKFQFICIFTFSDICISVKLNICKCMKSVELNVRLNKSSNKDALIA